MKRKRVPSFGTEAVKTKAIKLFFRCWTVKPQKSVLSRRTVTPLKYLL
jgi:hypothetical protein